MKLSVLLDGLPHEVLQGSPETDVADITIDSRAAAAKSLFIAQKGHTVDGHDFLACGAAAVLIDREAVLPAGITVIKLPSTAKALPEIARRFFGDPSRHLKIIGITGTNGKTTTAFLLRSIFEQAGDHAAVLGTVGYFIGTDEHEAPNTTPDALLLNRMLAECRDKKIDRVVMEVSSHALKLGRTEGIHFACGVFTNLTQDHLDFHPDMNDYFESKALLFSETRGLGAVNYDDPYGKELHRRFPSLLTFGLSETARKEGAVSADNIEMTIHGTRFDLRVQSQTRSIETRLVGMPNVENSLAAAAAAFCQGVSFDMIVRGLEKASPPPGRFELIETGHDFAIAVDYAHTPDALERLLATGRELNPSRLLVVFGCGGDRDRKKRPLMGKIASEHADEIWVTSDNPRTENPDAIISEIVAGMKSPYHRVVDRKDAIREAVMELSEGDLLLIAGKGHEDYQIIGRTKHFFDDRLAAAEILRGMK